VITLLADEKIESIIGKQKIFIKPTKDETKNWFQDYFFIGFKKESYHSDEIVSILKKLPPTSLKNPIWKKLLIENEDVLIVESKNSINSQPDNEKAFEQFKKSNLHNPKYAGKYVAFVNGSYEGVGKKRVELVKQMYKQFGNVEMFIEQISSEETEILFDSPE